MTKQSSHRHSQTDGAVRAGYMLCINFECYYIRGVEGERVYVEVPAEGCLIIFSSYDG